MVTKRVEERGLPFPEWDGTARPSIQVGDELPATVQVTPEQREAAWWHLARHGALDLVDMLGLTDVERVPS